MMKISLPRVLIASAVFAGGVAATLPAQADPPHWAPAYGHRAHEAREHRYVYYPARQVYYEPAQHLWFWMNGGGWQFGVSLPPAYRVYPSDGVTVVLNTARPYVEHAYVEERYGRPWRARHHDYEVRREMRREVRHHDRHDYRHDYRRDEHRDSHEHGYDRDHDRH